MRNENDAGSGRGPLGIATPGQIMLSDPDEQQASEERRYHDGVATGGLGDPTPAQSILQALQEQQDAMDTVRAGNRQRSANNDSSSSSSLQGLNYNGNIEDLFKAPFSWEQKQKDGSEEIEFQGGQNYDFREALLAEQRQQDAILRERQRSFEERHKENGSLEPAPSPQSSPVLSPRASLKPVSPRSPPKHATQQSSGHASNVPKPQASATSTPMRPPRISNGNRGASVPVGTASGDSHNRTVSWSLGNLETFHSDDRNPSNEAPNEPIRHSRSLSPVPGAGQISHRRRAPSRASFFSNRPRGLSEDAHVILGKSRIDLQDLMGVMPFESEAETNILRALDEFGLQNQMSKAEGSEDGVLFFSNLPEDFSLGDDLLGSDSEAENTANDSMTKGKAEEPSKQITNAPAQYHGKKMSDISSGNPSAVSGHQQSMHSAVMSSSQGRSTRQMQQQSSPSAQRTTSNVRPREHRYTQSVEQTLFGLTAQMSKLDAESLSGFHGGSDESSVSDAEDEKRKAKPEYKHHRVFSSADKLAETAHSLVAHTHKRDASQHSGQSRRPSLMRSRTLTGDADSKSHRRETSEVSSHFRGSSLSMTLRPSTPTDDIEAQQDGESAMRDKTLSRRRIVDAQLNSDDSSLSVEGTSQAKLHHAPTTVIEEEDEDERDVPEGVGGNYREASRAKKKRRKRRGRNPKRILAEGLKEDWELFNEFLSPRKRSIWLYCKAVFCFVVLPATGVAALLFYVLENPTTLENGDAASLKAAQDVRKASVSWWMLFLGVRQVVTLSLAMATQAFVIDFIALGSRFSLRLIGPVMTLLLVQSKGWPFIVAMWALYDLGLLAGTSRFVKHWGYWQDWLRLFNANNPSGTVTDDATYHQILRLAMIVGAVVALKRLVVGLFLGRQSFVHHGEELAKVMKRMVLVGEVAALSREPLPQSNSEYLADSDHWKSQNLTALMAEDEGSTVSMQSVKDLPDVDAAKNLPKAATKELPGPTQPNPSNNDAGGTAQSNHSTKEGSHSARTLPTDSAYQAPSSLPSVPKSVGGNGGGVFVTGHQTIMDLLERWEEPERFDNNIEKKVTLGAVLQFRRALAFTKKKYPFSPAFGPADTRELCVESAQNVYNRLLLRRSDQYEDLNFETLAVLATDSRGTVDEYKLKDLIKVFRPDRDGKLTRLAFVKSIDVVYKRLRLLSANVHNSSQIDVAVENIVNVGFYGVLGCIALSRLGIDPLQLFFSLSSVILAFAFMFGSGAAKYFEGVLLILLQRPFGVGDRIHVSNCQQDLSMDGQAGWIVERVNLFNTTLCFGATNERATISNGSLASSRIINAARSPNAVIYVQLKFGIDVPYEKVLIFRRAAEQHVAARPREWLAFLGFRAGAISVDRGFITYSIVVQHREPWQNIVSILESKATLTTYCLEVAKQLDMRYTSPPLPVDLSVFNSGGLQLLSDELLRKNA